MFWVGPIYEISNQNLSSKMILDPPQSLYIFSSTVCLFGTDIFQLLIRQLRNHFTKPKFLQEQPGYYTFVNIALKCSLDFFMTSK